MIMSYVNNFEFQTPDMINLESAADFIFYFTLYSLAGWLLENSYNYFTNGKFLKENFLFGPFKPMYGFAPVILIYLDKLELHWTIVLILCFAIPTIIEYLSGALLYKVFRRRWWDYSDSPLQLHGHISLPFCICWLVLAYSCLKWIHPAVEYIYQAAEPLWYWIWPAVSLYFIADLVMAVRKHSMVPDTINTIDTID